jgi:hypothetical protein
MNELVYFEQQVKIASIHAERIEESLKKIDPLLPITLDFMSHISLDQRNCLDVVLFRFAKLQDLLGEKLFPLIITFAGKDPKKNTYIDQLNILEKMELLPSRIEWMEMRKLRNRIAHDYPCDTDTTLQETNNALDAAKKLAAYWHTLLSQIQKLADQYKEAI